MFRLVLFTHVVGAIVSVGPAVTYGIWTALARRAGTAEEIFAFRTVLWLDSHVVTPAFAWQLVSGLLLTFVFSAAQPSDPWLVASLALYGLVMMVGLVVVGPRARCALRDLESVGVEGPLYLSYRRMIRRIAPLISLATLAIVFLMVVRPG